MEHMKIGRASLTWLYGGVTHMDGGAMFGVVPKPLWSKKYPVNDRNQIELRTDPILLEVDGKRMLVDAGIGNEKMNEKQKRNFGVWEESSVTQCLDEIGLKPEDIDAVLMTHLHFDHACGLTRWEGETLVPTFPNATIYTSETEWEEMRQPNMRSKNTYWEANWKAVEGQVHTFAESLEVAPGLKMIHTSGHSNGHSILTFEDGHDVFIHMADLMPTHAHQNVLWALAYDDYPVTSVHEKKKWMDYGYQRSAWYVFYHDAIYRALKFDEEGKIIDERKQKKHTYNV
ncbi:Glyoxylase, beta-lactamase superfamily II [Halobacillus karajensis]|uniref:N-acyl homoserine lactonase n=1 Tax=Halobacillus karajensis TaxID=195088 RepID=A0A024P772_9BACI|nr:MBL fold metallo-hydrolase [Halobacillus karajensis]CDQ18341.1 N-acyl homoserine lactonase [Halobacillus karajensis]CDQ24695.1 N-acyl homoserine lactonase [Halobacillus karajensis]CDQ29059.1 N-acyl homoserine lactonase [Halobacillus karajensis]SEI06628.1 Glyoxylase, beta-lactamase superfamily II [Halobacillus karajensis]